MASSSRVTAVASNLRRALEIVHPATKFIPVVGQYLEPSLKGLMKLFEMMEQAESNEKTLASLAARAASLSVAIVDHLKDRPQDEHKMEPLLKGISDSIKETETYDRQRAAVTGSKAKLKNLWKKGKDVWSSGEGKEVLQRLSKQMDDSIQQFLVISGLKQLWELDQLGGHVTRIMRWMEDQLLSTLDHVKESPDLPKPGKCLSGTFSQLLEELVAWANSRDEQRVYWLSGLAGTGKSTVARTLCDKLASSPGAKSEYIISFFISRLHADFRNPRRIVHTLSYRLAQALPNFREELLGRLSPRSVSTWDLSSDMKELIALPLARCGGDQHQTVVIVIDALDECDAEADVNDDDQDGKPRGFLPSLLSIVKQSNLHIRLLITSRSIPSIDRAFHHYRPLPVSQSRTADCVPFLYEHKIDISSLDADIEKYFVRSFKTIAEREALDNWPGHDRIQILVERASGLFIYATTVVGYVSDGYDPEENLNIIMTPGDSPDDSPDYGKLDKMYGVVLTIATSSTAGPRAAEQKETVVQRVLGALVVSQEPLTVVALAELLGPGTRKRTVDGVLRQLAGVLRVEWERILYHATFRDYLVDKSRCTEARFHVDPTNAHRALATRCFAIMNASLNKNDLIGLGDPSTVTAHVADLDSKISGAFSFPLIYACKYWCDHLTQSQMETPADSRSDVTVYTPLEAFCKTRLLRWIEASSLLGHINDSESLILSALECFQAWTRNVATTNNGHVSSENLANIAEILRDAGRFLSMFHDHIASRPLQAYVCAALFLPHGALLRAVSHTIGDEFRPAQPTARAETWGSLLLEIDTNGQVQSVPKLMAVSPDSSRFVTVGRKYESGNQSSTAVQLWDVLSGVCLKRLVIEDHSVWNLVIEDHSVWNLVIEDYLWGDQNINPLAFAFSSLGDYVVIVSGFRFPNRPLAMHVWDLGRNTSRLYPYHYSPGCESVSLSVAFSSDDRHLSMLSSDGIKHFLTRIEVVRDDHGMSLRDAVRIPLSDDPIGETPDIDPESSVYTMDGDFRKWASVLGSHSVGGEYYAIARTAKAASIYQGESGIATFQIPFAVSALEFEPPPHPHGQRLSTGGMDGSVVVWSLREECETHHFRGHDHPVRSLAFSSPGPAALLASASCFSMDSTVIVWSLDNGCCIWHHRDRALKMTVCVALVHPALSLNPRAFLFDNIGTIRVWDLLDSSGSLAPAARQHIRFMSFSPDNRVLAAGTDSTVCLWNIHSGKLEQFFPLLDSRDDEDDSWTTCRTHGLVFQCPRSKNPSWVRVWCPNCAFNPAPPVGLFLCPW